MEQAKSADISADKEFAAILNDFSVFNDYDELWKMFHLVINTGSWGTSEFGGPVWLMDFSLANLKKLYPESPWIPVMENEWSKGKLFGGTAESKLLRDFSEWFEYRARHLINQLGLGNVIIKQETSFDGNISLYGWGIFLDVVQSLVGGKVKRTHEQLMLKNNFSYAEAEAVSHGIFLTCLKSDGMVRRFPCFHGSGIHYVKHSDTYGDCYRLNHFSLTDGYVIPETVPEKFLMLIVNDLMECKAQGHGNRADKYGYTVPYPAMKFEKYLDCNRGYEQHFHPTADVFRWKRRNGSFEEIKVELPQIDAKYGKFWHRAFPPKQNWREL
ncbi:MAG: hypothetical protein IKN71_07255 [Alphaproteobacteria bacterium]|nr:hypothetical protein [Alphaproteobacteria bacterium]